MKVWKVFYIWDFLFLFKKKDLGLMVGDKVILWIIFMLVLFGLGLRVFMNVDFRLKMDIFWYSVVLLKLVNLIFVMEFISLIYVVK